MATYAVAQDSISSCPLSKEDGNHGLRGLRECESQNATRGYPYPGLAYAPRLLVGPL
jgi:hypothetical protein